MSLASTDVPARQLQFGELGFRNSGVVDKPESTTEIGILEAFCDRKGERTLSYIASW